MDKTEQYKNASKWIYDVAKIYATTPTEGKLPSPHEVVPLSPRIKTPTPMILYTSI